MIEIRPGLNYDDEDEKFIILVNVFQIIESTKSKNVLSRMGFKNRNMCVICIKIFFMSLFFDYELSKVIDELNNKKALRKFSKISDVPTEKQVSEYFSRFDIIQYYNMVNSILKRYFKPHKTICDEYIIDATPVACDINIVKKYIKNEHLKKLGLKWGYSTTKKYFVGFKVTVVLEKRTLTPVSILIHPGAPSDARIFEGILKELKRRGFIKDGDKLYFDKGYFSKENYQIGINNYKIIPIIFPKGNFDINRIKDELSYPLDIYDSTNNLKEMKNEILKITNQIVEILKKWKTLKPIRGIIEDFFKVAKKAFGLGKFHSYTEKSMVKNILLGLLLTTLVIQQGFKTKTQLQRLSEGYIDFDEPRTNKKNKDPDDEKTTDKNKDKQIKSGQQELEIKIQEQPTTLFNYSDHKSSKSRKNKQNMAKNKKSSYDKSGFNLIKNLTNIITYPYNRFIYS